MIDFFHIIIMIIISNNTIIVTVIIRTLSKYHTALRLNEQIRTLIDTVIVFL